MRRKCLVLTLIYFSSFFSSAHGQTQGSTDGGTKATNGAVVDAVRAKDDVGKQMLNLNNLKVISISLHNYLAAHRHLPATTNVGKDAKTKHSWRVAILPYIEQAALYEQYHQDEPWDSDNNKKLIDKMPAIYRSPFADPRSKSASYFMPTGDGTIGGTEKGATEANIKDGLANTFLLIEAKRDIPWTKPEDIEIDPDPSKPPPKYGGFNRRGTFSVAFADGSVSEVDNNIEPAKLRAFFTMAGGEKTDSDLRYSTIIGRKNEPLK